MLDLKGKNVVVLGLGISGAAAARLCLSRGAKVTGADAKKEADLAPEVRTMTAEGLILVPGGHADDALASADLVVISPGVPSFAALEKAEKKGVPVIGEVELACQSLTKNVPIIAIGGTNGKSTTTTLVADLLETNGRRVFRGGNLGEPLALHVDEAWDVIVLEVSSFQMERLQHFQPRASILLNVTADHLDRYPSFEAYADAKGNAFVRQSTEDTAVVPVADEICLRQAKRGRGRVMTFGPGGDIDVTSDAVIDRRLGHSFSRARFGLQGGHNALNIAAAIAAAREFQLDFAQATDILERFTGLPHRMALAGEIRGVRFYDDSKGTNVGASVTALRGLVEDKAVLIAGGRDKGGSYEPLVSALRDKGRAVVLIGEAAERIKEAVGGVVPVHVASTLDEAVNESLRLAKKGDAVLLSPACSSFDMFRDYKHRGDEFVRVVRALSGAGEERAS